jgi:ArsR family transcriptional regulator, arsenate/arsenite/antimonite-responsive transcriptional repressor
MRDIMAITKALGDENRVRILMLLEKDELCVCQVLEVFDLAPSTVSKHLSILYQAGFLDSRKEGRWVYYRLAGKEAPKGIQNALSWITDAARNDPQVIADREQLSKILCLAPEELCKLQAER